MKKLIHSIFILFFGIVYIFFTPGEPALLNALVKIIPILLIIILAMNTKNYFSARYKKFVVIGLIVCMVADAVIYWFLAGLVTFFIGHIFYIIAFHAFQQDRQPRLGQMMLTVFSICMTFLLVISQLQAKDTVLVIAIPAYIFILFLMGWKALGTRLPLTIIGAILFIISDSILAINRFIEPVPYSTALVMIPYYSAQFLIAKSIGSRVVKYSVNPKNLIK